MKYIVFDLEFNQNLSEQLSAESNISVSRSRYPFEIIQIGAIKLDEDLHTVAKFKRFIKPTIYSAIDPFITELTGITTEQLKNEEVFPDVYQDYLNFIGGSDNVFCIWGMSDIKELYKSAEEHQLSKRSLPKNYINLQPYASVYFKLPVKKLLGLQYTVEALGLPIDIPFHDALNDAIYTAEVLKKIYHPSMLPVVYDPAYIKIQPRIKKKEIDFAGLIRQFEKMYQREMTEEEQGMIALAYKMGKTNQFLKQESTL